jgi:hypothetical protein
MLSFLLELQNSSLRPSTHTPLDIPYKRHKHRTVPAKNQLYCQPEAYPTYVQVPTKTISTLALVNSDMSAANASTKASSTPATALLHICVKYRSNMGISRTVTAIQTVISLPTTAIFALEKKWTDGSCVPWTSVLSCRNR